MSVDVGRGRTIAIVIVAAILLALAGRLIDVPRLAGKVKGDEATYVAMTLSLAHDGDLRYEPEGSRALPAGLSAGAVWRVPQANAHGEPAPAAGLAPDCVRPHAGVVGRAPVVREGLRVSTPGRAVCAHRRPRRHADAERHAARRLRLVRRALLSGAHRHLARRHPGRRVRRRIGRARVRRVSHSEIFNFSIVLFAYFLWLDSSVRPGSDFFDR